MKPFFLIIIGVFGFYGLLAQNYERITDFSVDIKIEEDASVLVTENITVVSTGDQIKRGIFRQIPLRFNSPNGERVVMKLEIISVQKDGREEPYRPEMSSGEAKIYIGQQDVMLRPGTYTYTINYVVEGNINYFDDFDEIYYNVTGDKWGFVIEKASAKVTLPDGVPHIQQAAYTGSRGESGQDFTFTQEGGDLIFRTTRELRPQEGFTIGVGWPKGHVYEPPGSERIGAGDSTGYYISIVVFFIMIAYLFFAWVRVGIDPKKGVIVPQFAPPDGYSPGDCRYVNRMGFDTKTIISDIVDLGVKGLIRIDHEKKKFTLVFQKDSENEWISKSQKGLLDTIKNKGEILLDQKNQSTLAKMQSKYQREVQQEMAAAHFRKNSGYMIPGFILLVAGLFFLIVLSPTKDDLSEVAFPSAFILLFYLIGWSMFTNGIVKIFDGKFSSVFFLGGGIFLLFSTIFWAVFVQAFYFDFMEVFVMSTVYMFTFGLFIHLMVAPTSEGRKIMDHLEGLKLFMTKAEKYRFDALQDPAKGLELFEKLLPFAIALNVDNAWGKSFDTVVQKALMEESTRSSSRLYSGTGTIMTASALTGSLSSSLSSSFSSSSASSSSGSGGGGSSGGGSGGGGGGGW